MGNLEILNDLYSSWCGGEPNNAGGSGTTVGEGCAEMSSSLCLNDNSCSNSLSYVCEYGIAFKIILASSHYFSFINK